MAKTIGLKIPADIEYHAIGDAFGLLIASAGLLAGTMVQQRSFDFWLEDIAPLLIASWFAFRLFRDLLSTMTAYKDLPSQGPARIYSEGNSAMPKQLIAGQLPASSHPTPDQVMEEVARRLDEKREKAQKANKFTN